MSYVDRVIETVIRKNPAESEFHQAVTEVLNSLRPVMDAHPEYEECSLLERLCEPERVVMFRVPWVDDKGQVQVNRGFRVQFNSAIGPYKGGLRFHPSVNLGIIKFLGFEQIFKNSLTGLPIGGGKGGSDFDPKGKSDREVMALLPELYDRAVHVTSARTPTCPPATSAWAAGRSATCSASISASRNQYEGVLTGKGLTYGGSLARTEATGYGLLYFTDEMLEGRRHELCRARPWSSPAPATWPSTPPRRPSSWAPRSSPCQRLQRLCLRSRTALTSQLIKEIKEVKRGRIKEYAQAASERRVSRGQAASGAFPATSPCPAPPRTSCNERGRQDCWCKNGVHGRGARAQTCPPPSRPSRCFQENGVLFAPGKAANAGGVATSALEMSQNSMRLSWTFDEVDEKLHNIMVNIHAQRRPTTAERYGHEGQLCCGRQRGRL